MGKVFTWEEVEAKQVPLPCDFLIVERTLREELKSCAGVVGAIICGSYNNGGFNQRSDLDCLVVYNPDQQQDVLKVLQGINKLACRFYIPLELIPMDLQIVKTLMHPVEYGFLQHLNCAANNGGVIKNDPLPYLCVGGLNSVEGTRGYIRHKLRRMEKGMVKLEDMKSPELCLFLQKMVDSSIHIARQILRWHNFQLPDDSKRTVIENYPQVADRAALILFEEIISADKAYAAELLAQLNIPDKVDYMRVIGMLKAVASQALEFVKINAILVS